jgi:hypothetical protein
VGFISKLNQNKMNLALLAMMSGGAVATVEPNALLQDWWDNLVVKPSNSLMTALNELSAGLDADGNWALLDLFGLLGGMETQEQQLSPLITTSSSQFTIMDTPTLNVNGLSNNGGLGYLDLNWNPSINGVQYSLNNAFFSTYVVNEAGYITTIAMGAVDTVLPSESDIQDLEEVYITGAINVDIDNQPDLPYIITGDLSYYGAVKINSGNLTLYKNSNNDTVPAEPPVGLVNLSFFGAGINADGVPNLGSNNSFFRHFMAGSGSADQTEIMNRLNTFYAARGL